MANAMQQFSLQQQAAQGKLGGNLGPQTAGLGSINPAAASRLGNAVMGRPTNVASPAPTQSMANAMQQFSLQQQAAQGKLGGNLGPQSAGMLRMKKGGMVNKKKYATGGAVSSVKPRNCGGKGVKTCKVC